MNKAPRKTKVWRSRRRIYSAGLQDKHGVAIRKETETLSHGPAIGFHRQLIAGKSAHQHQQGRSWQMEIGQQAVDVFESIARIDEYVRRELPRLNRTV